MAKLNGKETQIIQDVPKYGMMSKEAYMEKGRAAARSGEKLEWVSTPKSWQEKAVKAGYEEVKALRHKLQPETLRAVVSGTKTKSSLLTGWESEPAPKKKKPNLEARKAEEAKDKARGVREKGQEIHDKITSTKVTKDKDPGVTAAEVAAPGTLSGLRNHVRNLEERMNGIKGALNATRQTVERQNNTLDDRALEISRLERQKAWAHKKEEEATENLEKALEEVATTYGILGGMEVFLTSLQLKYTRKDDGPKVYAVNELEMHTLQSLLGSAVMMLRPLHPEIARMQQESDAAVKHTTGPNAFKMKAYGEGHVFKEGDEVKWSGVGKDLYEGIVRYLRTDGRTAVYGRMVRGTDGLYTRNSQSMIYAVDKEDLRLRKKATLPSHFKLSDTVRFTMAEAGGELIAYQGLVIDISEGGESLKVLGNKVGRAGYDPQAEFCVESTRAVRVDGAGQTLARVPSDFGKGDRVKFPHYMGNDGTRIVTGTVEDPKGYAYQGRVCVRVDKLLPPSTSPLQTVMAKDLELLDAAEEFVEAPLTT